MAGGGMMLNTRRSNIEIIADMLRVGNNGNGAGKTEIMYSANMSYAQIQKYLAFLMAQGLISKVQVGNPSIKYQVTDKGNKLLKNIDDIMEMLGLEEAIGL
jgi:predicted transcriptional regulator